MINLNKFEVEDIDIVKSIITRKLSLKERLEIFDQEKHGKEVMSLEPIGAEKF